MEQNSSKKNIKKLIIYLVLIIVIGILSNAFHFTTSFTEYISNISISPDKILRLLSMVFVVLFLEEIVRFILSFIHTENHRINTISTVINSSVKYITAIVIICWGLSIVGVDVATIAASVGILALIVGFGAESLIADAVTGIFMLFENQYNVGDIIEVNGFRGTVEEIGIRTTSIRDGSNNVKIINNSLMTNILNRSDHRSTAVCDIGVPYEIDLEEFESKKIPAILAEIYENHKDIMLEEPKYIGVQTLGASAITLRFIAAVPESDIYSGTRILNHDLLILFKKNGVSCPYNQLDIHTKS